MKEGLGEGGSARVPVHATSSGKIIISAGPVGWCDIASAAFCRIPEM